MSQVMFAMFGTFPLRVIGSLSIIVVVVVTIVLSVSSRFGFKLA